MILDILQHPDPRLGQVAEDASPDDGSTLIQRDDFKPPQSVGPMQSLLTDMVHTMMNSGPALGLAAPQVGHSVRAICVFEPKTGAVHAMLNPRIIKRSGVTFTEIEGCLSVDKGNRRVRVKRHYSVVVEGASATGASLRVSAKGQLAAAFQHEIAHLDGVTIADLTPPRQKRRLEGAGGVAGSTR